jgi:YVTN family beta-propeller protein
MRHASPAYVTDPRRLLLAFSCILGFLLPASASADFAYSVYDGTFSLLPDFSGLTPTATATSTSIGVGVTSQTDTFALAFTNTLNVPTSGDYEFMTNSDDGSRVYIDGALVVDNDGLHAPAVVVGSVSLAAGTYALRVEFFENQGGEVLDVGYRSGNPAFEPIPADGQLSFTPFDRSELGEWGGVIGWPEIAISAANLPDGRILTWSSTETNAFPSNTEFTHASVFDPATTTFETVDSNFHDMFCAGVASLENGQIIAAGGNPQDRKTSSFDPATLSWTRLADMNDERWYATAITMPSNQIFSSFGKGAANRSERYDPAIDVWTATTNANMQTLVNEQNAINGLPNPGNALTQEWFSHLAVTPQGDVFQGGPTPTWHRFDPVGGAANVVLGQPIGDVARMYGNAVTYDEGKVLLVGGSDRRLATPTSVNNVYRIDLSGPAPVVTAGTPMNFPRALSNSVTLPNGEVLVIGGNTVARIFTDEGAVLPAEIYNPSTDTWRVVDAITIPRNYHSTALLMKDARVLSAGGGACGNCNANHLDGQIYSPPYLFESDDTPAIRPTLTVSGTPQVRAGENLVVTASSDTVSFSIVRLSATTHHMNTDQRFMPVASIDNQNGTFDLTFSANPNVLIVGNYWLFALDVDGTPSLGQTIQVIRDLDPPIDDSVYVSDLAWESEQNFFGPAERDQSNGEDGAGDGNTLELEGVQYAKGIGVHAYSEIAVRLDGLYDRFRSDIGLDDERDALCGDVHFRIDLDGLNVYSSGNFVDTTPTESVDLDVSGSTIMTLKVQDNGATCGDHADWADARLTPTPLPGYRYYRFRSTKLRDDVGANAIQLAELSLFLQSFRQSATTVLNPGGNNPPSEGPSSADDADVNTKWLDFNRGALVYDFGLRVEIDAYSFTTANDADDRDPVRWVFEGSQNGVGWEILDDRSSADYPTPTARLTSTGIFDVELLDVITPLPEAPRNSSTLIVETSNNDEDRIWNVNPDNDSVSVLDAAGTLLTEIGVGDAPWALAKRPGANRVYVTNKRSATITVLDTQTLDVDHTVDLARGSQPHGIVFSADGSHYYVVLEALARLEKRASIDDSLVSNLTLGGTPRHLGMRFDDSRVIVSDFITPPIPGESTLSVDVANGISNVFVVDPTSLTLTTTIPITYDDRGQSESQGPGMPNYLGPPVVSFDELYAYIPSKKDNIAAGALRQIPGLGFESTVRANSSRILLGSETEDPTFRVDHDNAGLATGAALSGDGRYLFVTLETSRELAVYDTINGFQLMRLPTGRAPQSVALSSDGSIAYVHDFMDRQISRFDLTDMLQTHLPSTNALGPVSVVTTETLAPDVLLGKQHFYDGEDDRISLDNYISCASCHSDGGHDGRVWDFGGFGEGLRSTPSLRGHGEEHGLSHWSGNFDEIQDFDIQFRNLALGLGFLTITQHNATLDPLGAPKAGMNTDLDALAAYLAFLTDPPESPHRPNATSLSASALQGQSDFGSLGCLGCHAQPALNDSSLGLRHDVGTIDTASGSRLGGTLDGFDTPGLLGIWLDPPYLHDGSAATIGDAITSHTAFSGLAPATVDSLGDFLREAEPADMLDFDTDGDGTLDVDDPDVDDPCIPMVFVAVCLADTDNDGTTDFDEGEGVDSDGDGLFDFEESSILDSDGDTVVDQDDATNNDGCFPDPMFCPAAPVDATTPVGQILLVLLLGLAAPILYRHEKGWNRN